MNTQRFLISTVAVFVFLYAFEYIVHGHLLMPTYMETPQLWRSPEAMQALLPWSIGIGLALSATITYLFTRHYEAKGYGEGVRFGLIIGLLLGIMQFGAYTYLPISLHLALTWFVVYVVEGIGIGLVLATTYKA